MADKSENTSAVSCMFAEVKHSLSGVLIEAEKDVSFPPSLSQL